jgi:hypothetical protein
MRRVLQAGLLALLMGCHLSWVRRIDLSVQVLNESNQLLIVEGQCNLPDGALLEARLSDRQGRRWAAGRGPVRQGRYFVILEISRCPGFKALNLDVFFDPLTASAQVQRITGERGEALAGPMVVELHGRALVYKRSQVVLAMSARQLALRRLEAGDGDIEELQSYLARHPNNAESLIGLGLAFLKQRASQRHSGSEACKMLEEGLKLKNAPDTLEMQARLWLARIEDKERREAAERERLRGPTFHSRFLEVTQVVPGLSLGAFELGMPLSFLESNFRLQPLEPGKFSIPDFPGLRLELDVQGKLGLVASTDPKYRTHQGIGPGSDLADLRLLVPDLQVRFGETQPGPEGKVYATCLVELNGVNLLLERSYNPEFPIPEEVVREIQVVPAITP